MLFSLISERILAGALLVYVSATPIPIDKSTLDVRNEEVIKLIEPYTIERNVGTLQQYAKSKNTYINGVTIFSTHSICISDRVTKSFEKERILYHEIGHVLDYELGYNKPYSGTDELQHIFEEERSQISYYSGEYFFTDLPSEFFAESYSMYICKREKLKKYGPLVYEYLDKIAHEDEPIE